MSVTASQLLLKAAALIDERGLNQNGDWVGTDGSLCTIGALDAACLAFGLDNDLDAPRPPERKRARAAIGEVLAADLDADPDVRVSVVFWNDEMATKEDVISLLRRAAENVQ